MMNKRRPRKRINALTFAKMMRLLKDGAYTLHELSEETGLSYGTVSQYCRCLYDEKLLRVVMWAMDNRGRAVQRVYTFGDGPDTKKPAPLTPAQRQARVRARQKMKRRLARMAGPISCVVGEDDALQIESTAEVDVCERPRDGETMGTRNP